VPTLHDLQRRLAAALFDDAPAAASADIRAHEVSAVARLGIYRRQVRATFRRTLALEYPVIERLVGREYFQQLALEFQAVHPSRAGDLHHIGAPFAAFLRERFCGGAYDYLSHVAALEWAYQESLLAPEVPAFDSQALQRIDPADYARLHFAPHPACRLYFSAYPVLDIWHANQARSAVTQTIDLANGATRILLQRHAHAVQFHRLSAASFALFGALAQQLTLGEALAAAHHAEAEFDLGAALRHFVALGAFADATLGPCGTPSARPRGLS
jgi:hypothetical protein